MAAALPDEAAQILKIGDEFVDLGHFNDAAQRLLASQQKQGSTAVRGSTGKPSDAFTTCKRRGSTTVW
eukprot:m.385714 g.385714  ORF g.385714 m.385714 type:complete len:68 (+) comp16742_c1_seq6:100-303(+)